jgi:threonine aldolase
MWFASDNTSPAAPEVLAAVLGANGGHAASYGADAAAARVTQRLREIFEAPEAAVHLVATGTAANALALACLCPPWSTIYCHRSAHVEEDECGAPEFYTGGAKLTLLDGAHAKIAAESLEATLAATVGGGVHHVQPGALSLTNATEAGAVYRPGEIARLAALAKGAGLPVHMDGARFANALECVGCTPAELTWRAGVDVLSFGGTKNGCMGVEAVILFDPAKSWEFELRRKRGGHLFSKHRYLSAQMEGYLADDLWRTLAAQANARARQLSAGIAASPGARLLHPTEANAVFAAWPRAGHRAARAAGAQYYLWPGHQSLEGPDEELLSARLVCNWSTSEAEVEAFLRALRCEPAAGRETAAARG